VRELNALLKLAHEQGASDLHIKVGSPPLIRVNGRLVPLSSEDRVSHEDSRNVGVAVMSKAQQEAFKIKNDLDFAYSVPGLGRFRCNAFLQRGALGLVFRLIPTKIPSIEDLNLPDVLNRLVEEERGLVLVTGTTGSGKSTTLASMIDRINSSRTVNIVTIEDPIEYLHRDKQGIINQREIGADTFSFADALMAALRQDPDVILVGEMRDTETIETALIAAETGHLVFSTLHTLDARETVNRIIAMFPPHQHSQIRIQLSTVLKGIVSQRLMPRADGEGRIPAVEVLLATALIRECVVDPAKTKLITDTIAQGRLHYGMQTFDQSIFEHYKNGLVTYEEALKWTSNTEDFKLKVQGVHSGGEAAVEKPEKTEKPAAGGFRIERFSK
jgi:twitching motility protein PilT